MIIKIRRIRFLCVSPKLDKNIFLIEKIVFYCKIHTPMIPVEKTCFSSPKKNLAFHASAIVIHLQMINEHRMII